MNKNIGLFCASSNNLDAVYYEEAGHFGRWLAETGKTLIYGGNNRGLMEATAKGFQDYKSSTLSSSSLDSQVIGIVPQILIDKGKVSRYLDSMVLCQELNERKRVLLDKSDVIVVMPGSIGTLDEAFSVMASNSIGLHDKKLIFWNINFFWTELFMFFESLNKKGVVNKPWPELYSVANNLEELTALIDG